MRTRKWETPSKFTVTGVELWKFWEIEWRRLIRAVILGARAKESQKWKRRVFLLPHSISGSHSTLSKHLFVSLTIENVQEKKSQKQLVATQKILRTNKIIEEQRLLL